MRRRSAALELTLLAVVVVTALLSVSSWLALRRQRDWMMEQARQNLALTGDAIESSLRFAMMQNRREAIDESIARIMRQTRVRDIRITAPREVKARTVIEENSLRAFTPILAEQGCIHQACHVSARPGAVLGVMDIRLPLDEMDTDLAALRTWFLGMSLASVLAAASIIWLALARTFRNMTGQVIAAQDKLIQSERLISMGKLAAGVAHEINNPLTGILSYGEALLEDAAPDDPRRKDYEVIVNETLRSRNIVRGLLDFARQDTPARAPVEAGDLIERALRIVAKQAAFGNIEFERRIEPGLPRVEVDRVQMEQVLLNLVVNAQQAMPEGGRIVVYARPADQAGQVEISVEDNGGGIPPEVRPHIFEPFFSTKGGKTDGLGLAVCLGIVQRHGGTIAVESSPGGGSTFRITLPGEGHA